LLEFSKQDLERRLRKKISEVDDQVERKKQVVANEHTTKKARLEAELEGKLEECRELAKDVLEVEGELASVKFTTLSMSQRMTEKLVAERAHLAQLEAEKRDAEVKARLVAASVDLLSEQLATLEKETTRLKAQTFVAQTDLMEEEDRNHQLEQTIKRLESRI